MHPPPAHMPPPHTPPHLTSTLPFPTCPPTHPAALPVPATAAGTSSATTATPTTNEQRRGAHEPSRPARPAAVSIGPGGGSGALQQGGSKGVASRLPYACACACACSWPYWPVDGLLLLSGQLGQRAGWRAGGRMHATGGAAASVNACAARAWVCNTRSHIQVRERGRWCGCVHTWRRGLLGRARWGGVGVGAQQGCM